MKNAALIVNPYSTQVTGERITAVERALRERVELQTTFTQHAGHATELAAEFAGRFDAILVFSGDGTYNEALNGADADGRPLEQPVASGARFYDGTAFSFSNTTSPTQDQQTFLYTLDSTPAMDFLLP